MKLTTFIINKIIIKTTNHAFNGPHLIKDCNESICNRCKPNLDNHTPVKCLRKRPLTDSKDLTPPIVITDLDINLMATMIQVCNCQFPPVNKTILLNH